MEYMNEQPSKTTNKPWFRRGPVRALVPLSVTAVIAGGAALLPSLASATPSLPAVSAQQLLTKIAGSKVDAFSGTVNLSTNLGLPQLPDLSGSANPFSLLSGTHTLEVAANGPQQQRIALLDQLSEYDFVHNGTQIWTYDSETNSVEHGTSTGQGGQSAAQAKAKAQAEKKAVGTGKYPPLTPQAAAQQLLTGLSPTTQVSVGAPRTVAGRSAYLLVLTPKQQGSLIGQADIAVDSATGAPLGVSLYPVGSGTPLFDVSFTSVSLTAPDASRFDFTPPKGATVTPLGAGEQSGSAAKDGESAPTQQSLDPQVLGTSWLSVLELHNVSLSELQQTLSSAGSAATQGSNNSPESDGGSRQLVNGGVSGYLNSLLGGGTSVSGKFGSGKVYTTSVLSVLITEDGRVFLGAVTPKVLEADAAAQGSK